MIPTPGAGHQLHADARLRIDGAQVVDQLRQVLDAVDVMMRRRRNQHHAGHRVPQTRDVDGNFAGRKLSAFARLRALRNLDFEFVGVHQIFGSHSEARRRHLLDPVVGLAAVAVDLGVFAALAGIAAAAEAVHGDGESAVRLRRNRAQRHGLRAEAAQDRSFGFHLVERQRLAGNNLQQVPDCDRLSLLAEFHEGAMIFVGGKFDVAMHSPHQLRRAGVLLSLVAEAIEPVVLQFRASSSSWGK